MKTYADYEFYRTKTKGVVPSEQFERLAVRATRYIDAGTLGKAAALGKNDPRMQDVMLCCCELVDEIYNEENGGGIASESNDGITINYVKGISNTKSTEEKIYNVLVQGLARTGLLYKGASRC